MLCKLPGVGVYLHWFCFLSACLLFRFRLVPRPEGARKVFSKQPEQHHICMYYMQQFTRDTRSRIVRIVFIAPPSIEA
jgi:hypothetical protein